MQILISQKFFCVTGTATNCSLVSEEKLRAGCDMEETLSNGLHALRRADWYQHDR